MLSRTTPSGKTVYYNSKTRSRQSEKPQGSGSSLRNIAYAIGAVLLLTVAAAGPNLVENLG